LRNRKLLANEVSGFRLRQSKVFTPIKKNLFSKWHIQANLDQWLDALPLQRRRSSFDIIEETLIEDERRKREPHILHKGKKCKADKGDHELYKIDVFSEVD
jgi:hypothetical protein